LIDFVQSVWWFEPVSIIGGTVIAFYIFKYILESAADLLGIDEHLD
tara:strand:+ start:265 stop:402 length:138 start_codon:yes stop_codon:yes gene_type:complete